MLSGFKIGSNPVISAIYYALLQCGYEYVHYERNEQHVAALAAFRRKECIPFFADVRQNTCEVYPYWPRAALLETASFHLAADKPEFRDWEGLRHKIMEMSNLADNERDGPFWMWMSAFPVALNEVIHSEDFLRYLEWEEEWIKEQNILYDNELKRIAQCVEICAEEYHSTVKHIQLVVNPIKCVYSADYHLNGDTFIYCSGRLQSESVIHEFLHHVVHPVVSQHRELIMHDDRLYPGIDASYYAAGRLNAFEEHMVRVMTNQAAQNTLPKDLNTFVRTLL